jgi:hypothetical protein
MLTEEFDANRVPKKREGSVDFGEKRKSPPRSKVKITSESVD